MATIIEGGLWTLSDAAAKHLEAKGLIRECTNNHPVLLAADRPFYHISLNSPRSVGAEVLHSLINDAEKAVDADKS